MWVRIDNADRKFIKEALEWCLQNTVDDEEFMNLNREEQEQFARDIVTYERLIKKFS